MKQLKDVGGRQRSGLVPQPDTKSHDQLGQIQAGRGGVLRLSEGRAVTEREGLTPRNGLGRAPR
jgi:hypothetical protein